MADYYNPVAARIAKHKRNRKRARKARIERIVRMATHPTVTFDSFTDKTRRALEQHRLSLIRK